MVARDKAETLSGPATLADGWAKYRLAHEQIEQADWTQVLALLAQAETIFRTHNDANGLWRALIGQALLHWRDGMAEMAEARALAALQVAEASDNGFAVGYVTWRLANLKIEQAQYAAAADQLDQAQLALDAVGMAPAGGVLAAAAQLCCEIVRWQQMHERGQIGAREAEAAIMAIHCDLIARLRQAAASMPVASVYPDAADHASAPLAPIGLPPAETPSLPWVGLSAWLSRLWRKLIHGDQEVTTLRATAAPTLGRGPPDLDVLALPQKITIQQSPDLEVASADEAQPIVAVDHWAGESQMPELYSAELTPAETIAELPGEVGPFEHAGRVLAKAAAGPGVERASVPLASPARPADSPSLRVQLFGQFRVALNGREIESWPSGRGRAIFKYLLSHRDRPLARDVLMEAFWPESSAESARNSLNVAIYGLRQALRAADAAPVVMFQNGAYRLNQHLAVWLDVDEFKRSLQGARRSEEAGDLAAAIAKYEAAAQLYQGDFMADDLADDWPVLPRERLRVDYLDTLDRLSHLYFTGEQYGRCVTLCQMLLAQDNCREDAHCRLMRCYSRQDQHLLALRQYQTCAEALDHELGVAPAAATTQLYERIRRREAV